MIGRQFIEKYTLLLLFNISVNRDIYRYYLQEQLLPI
jgi:hypothetical protein